MELIVVKNYEEMSRRSAEYFLKLIRQKPDCVLGLATGDTPIGTYTELVRAYQKETLDFSRVRSVNLDEYYPISPENDQSYRYFMNRHLFDSINIDKANTYVPDGETADTKRFCREYEEIIDRLGGIDLQILGIGRNGHVGFNEPDKELIPFTHLTALTPSTIQANARFFPSEDDVPKHALTMGLRSIFKAKKILLLASGKEKAEAIRAVLTGTIRTDCPASLLCLHADVTLICDEDTYSLM